jgi:hypothetical protein
VSALEIGLANSWRPPRAGWIVALRAPRDGGPPLSVADGDFVLLDADGNPVEEHSYIVMEVVAERHRYGWYSRRAGSASCSKPPRTVR